jgi:hypothetical protein
MINIFITAYILSCFKEVAPFFLSRTQVKYSRRDSDTGKSKSIMDKKIQKQKNIEI